MTRRPGVTLIEVLVSIFVTAVGLLALLALFPVGAFSMANAIKNGRCVQASVNAAAFARLKVFGTAGSSLGNIGNDPSLTSLYTNPDSVPLGTPTPPGSVPPLGPNYTGPSYPVYVDPVGRNILGLPFVGDVIFNAAFSYRSHLPRTSLTYFTTTGLAPQRFMTLLDDISFGPAAGPIYPSPALPQVEREDRYTWAYLLQRTPAGASEFSFVNAAIVVYSGRSSFVSGENTFNANASGVYQGVQWVAGTNQVDLTWSPGIGQAKPVIKNGTWILDATCVHWDQTAVPPQPAVPPEGPHGFFYRVVGVTEVPQTNTLTLELQTPIRASSVDAGPIFQPYGVLVVMENVVEVFEKRPL